MSCLDGKTPTGCGGDCTKCKGNVGGISDYLIILTEFIMREHPELTWDEAHHIGMYEWSMEKGIKYLWNRGCRMYGKG